jgi:hypothetical protein
MVWAGVFHHVEDVVHAGDQLVDVVAVDRGDEGLVQQVDARVGDLVRLFFDALHGVGAVFQVVEVGHQADHFLRTLHAQRRVLVEQVEKFALGGHQASKHMVLRW